MAINGKVTLKLWSPWPDKQEILTEEIENVEAVWSNRQYVYVRSSENPGEDSKGPFKLTMFPVNEVHRVIVDIYEATDKSGWYSDIIGRGEDDE